MSDGNMVLCAKLNLSPGMRDAGIEVRNLAQGVHARRPWREAPVTRIGFARQAQGAPFPDRPGWRGRFAAASQPLYRLPSYFDGQAEAPRHRKRSETISHDQQSHCSAGPKVDWHGFEYLHTRAAARRGISAASNGNVQVVRPAEGADKTAAPAGGPWTWPAEAGCRCRNARSARTAPVHDLVRFLQQGRNEAQGDSHIMEHFVVRGNADI
jgi:hypothetical protein